MRLTLAISSLSLLIFAAAAAQTTTTTGAFTVNDTDNIFSQGPAVTLNTTNAGFAATATLDTTTPTQVDGIHFAASPTGSGGTWTLDFDNGQNAVQAGSFSVDGTNSSAALSFQNGTSTTTCQAAFGTIVIAALTTDPAATTTSVFTNLTGSFDISCSNTSSSVNGTFSFTSTTTQTPTPPTPTSGGSNNGTFTFPRIGPFAGTPTTPTEPSAPPPPALSISGPVQTLLGPVDVATGDTTTLAFTTITNADTDVVLSASSDTPGLTFTFSPATIAAPGNGTTNLTIGTRQAVPGDFIVIVTATGGGLAASTAIVLEVFCDPPVILGVGQPGSMTVINGGSAQLIVAPLGSGPLTYQWYEGYQGFTDSPVEGGTSATLTTPMINSPTQFWVRVSNACGSVDSSTATISLDVSTP